MASTNAIVVIEKLSKRDASGSFDGQFGQFFNKVRIQVRDGGAVLVKDVTPYK